MNLFRHLASIVRMLKELALWWLERGKPRRV